jgi:hypothetical protein
MCWGCRAAIEEESFFLKKRSAQLGQGKSSAAFQQGEFIHRFHRLFVLADWTA